MTKISFDLDFNKDSETLLREIQDQAKAEVEKREGKERSKAYLSNLHETVNEKIGTTYNSVTELVRALAEHSSPAMRERISGSTVAGRRKTISMDRDLYVQIKEALSKPSPNKAAIARESNVSVVQVRKVAEGGYDEKFEGTSVESVASDSKPIKLPSIDIPSSEPEVETIASLPESLEIDLPPPSVVPEPESDPVIEELPAASPEPEEDSVPLGVTDGISPSLPPPPSFNDEDGEESDVPEEESDLGIPPPPSFTDEGTEELPSPTDSSLESEDEAESDIKTSPPPTSFEESVQDDVPSSLPASLPPVENSFADNDQEADSLDPAPIPPPAFDSDGAKEANTDDEMQLPPPALPPISEDLPNVPAPPAPPSSLGGEPDPPPVPPSPPTPRNDADTASPALGKKLGLKLGGPSKKPSLKLGGKLGKIGKPTLNITRPPMPRSLPPTPDS
jgi:hypothetical protein